jgi:methionine sulfoxide reductase heme-binding subunit
MTTDMPTLPGSRSGGTPGGTLGGTPRAVHRGEGEPSAVHAAPKAAARSGRTAASPRKGERWVVPAKVVVFIAAWYPLARLLIYGFTDRLGADPIRFITWSTGTWTLVFLCITLAVTPVRKLTGVNALLRFRRMLGLYAFFYATLHFTTYIWFDKWFDVTEIVKDIGKRPFITVGFAAFVLLVLLAATSPRAAARKLGRHWQTLHRAVYLIGGLAILHFWWMKASKHDLFEPKIYGAIMVALLGWRLLAWMRARFAHRRPS